MYLTVTHQSDCKQLYPEAKKEIYYKKNFNWGNKDTYVIPQSIKKFNLKKKNFKPMHSSQPGEMKLGLLSYINTASDFIKAYLLH